MSEKYCHQHGLMNPCIVCDEGYLVEGIRKSDERIRELKQKLAAAESIKQQLARFFHDAIELSFDGRDFDGGEMQERALGLGLIVETTPPDGEIGTWYEIAPGVGDE